MKKHYGNYLGIVVDNNDPEYRGRIQVFVPHIMPTLYEGWNKAGENISITCVGDNMPDGLTGDVIARLRNVLPWAEAASPIVGQSAPGGVMSAVVGALKSFGQSASNVISNVLHLDQTPTAVPSGQLDPGTALEIPTSGILDVKNLKAGFVQRLNALYKEATQLGYKIVCTSGYRDYNTQKNLYAANIAQYPPNGNKGVAAPGTSAHEFGIAVDMKVSGNGVNIQTLKVYAERTGLNYDTPAWQALLAKHGLHQPLHPSIRPSPSAPESWHVEPIEMPKAWQGDRPKKMIEISAKLSSPSKSIGETTSSSQFPAAYNPLSTSSPSNIDRMSPIAPTTNTTGVDVTSTAPTLTPSSLLNPTGTTVTSGPTSGLNVSTASVSQLAKDRIQLFEKELQNSAVLDRLEWLCFHQENKNNVLDSGALILETIVNRAHFGGNTLNFLITSYEYYRSTNKIAHTSLILQAIKKVVYNGQNHTNLATDNASNEAGNRLATKRVNSGCTGSWFDLETGKMITSSGEILKCVDGNSGSKEFLYRGDGGDGTTTKAGREAGIYAKKYNVQPTNPSTFNAGVPLPPELAAARKSNLTGNPISSTTPPTVVNNTDPHGPTIVKNTNDAAKGMFAFPGIGAMVWVFFREGNPLFPVYFAASYSSTEWKSAYNSKGSVNPEGTNTGNVSAQVSNSMKLNPNAGGGLEFTHIKDSSDPSGAGDKAVAMIYGDDGSNMVFSKGYHQIYTRHDRRDQVDGHLYSIVHGAEERWVDDDSSINIRGNVTVKIGKIDAESIDAMQELSDFSRQLTETLMSNAGN